VITLSTQLQTDHKPKIKFDGSITIATGKSRKETNWKNKELLWSELLKRLSRTTRTGETYSEYKSLPKSQQDEIKDVGGFVGGTLKGGRRKAESVVWRQLLTLDADFVKGDLWASVEMLFDYACAVYSTHKHHPDSPRLRLVIPLSRPITPDEYQAVSRRVAADIGIDFFDDTTFEPARLMYWGSTSQDAEFVFEYQDEKWLDPDSVLAKYSDWTDPASWPESSRVQQSRKRMADKQGDPLQKPGVIGAFCRAYTISEAIEKFLPDVYEPAADGRFTYLDGSTTGGLITYDHDTFAFSHHGTDPIGGQLVNAFDMVRIHKFEELDEGAGPGAAITKLPSYKAMTEFAESDETVAEIRKEERLAAIEEDFGGAQVDPRRLFFEEKRFIPAYMGEWFLQHNSCFVMNTDLYVYESGVYVKGERKFHEMGTAALGIEYTPKRLSDALSYIKNTVPEVSPQEVAAPGELLNLKNGLLDLETFALLPHSPDVKTVTQLPVSYDPYASTAVVDEFFSKVIPVDAIPIIEEMAGYCLIPSMKYEKALVLFGEGGNGKGTLISLIEHLLGPKNVAGVSFQDLAENRFASAELFGKMANLHADIPSKVLENSSRFKELVSGDTIRAEEKHKQPFNFRNRAKLIFSANEPPTSKDNTEGFHRRLLMVPFPNKFTDRELRAKLFTPEALSGFLVKALEGLKRLQKQDGFSKSEAVNETLSDYRKRSDSVMRFLDECCTFDTDQMTGKQVLYDAYREHCYQWGNKSVSQANFNARLQAIRPEIIEYRKTAPRRWRGILLNAPSEFL
jgi:P4 family phage/plasmid primase-like protien